MTNMRLDEVLHHGENAAPWSFPGDNGATVTLALFGKDWHTVEFVFYLQNTTTEIGRHSVTVMEGSPAPAPLTSPPAPGGLYIHAVK